jgi:hypothetical protein
LLVIVGTIGIFTKDFYFRETFNWNVQAIAQDIVDLFIISPILIVSAVAASKNSKTALLVWGGTNLFLIYTFAIYCFAVHFNYLFIMYCALFGLSIYSFVYFVFINSVSIDNISLNEKFPIKTTSIFLIIISVLFYLLWLSEIIPATINNSAPKSLAETGILTNPVHVIDLAVCLPGMIITAVLLFKKKYIGIILAPAVLVFCGEMSLSIGILMAYMMQHGLGADFVPLIFMVIITLVAAGFIIKFSKCIKA